MNKIEIEINPVAKPRKKRKRKFTDKQLLEAYKKTGNIWKAGEILNVCGQSVHERLQKLGVKLNNKKISKNELEQIGEVYTKGFKCGDGTLDKLSDELNRTKQLISRTAKKLGLSEINRGCNDSLKNKVSVIIKNWLSENEHPKGMKGKKHSTETKIKLSEKSISMWEDENSKINSKEMTLLRSKNMSMSHQKGLLGGKNTYSRCKRGWFDDGKKRYFMRSSWERNYGCYLNFLKLQKEIIDWEYEVDTFRFHKIKQGIVSYKPDFKIFNTDNSIEYHEVKGWMDSKSKTKIKRMAKYYPNIKLIIIGEKEYKNISKQKSLFKGWT